MIETTVETVSLQYPGTVEPTTDVREVAGRLRRRGVSALPVVEGDALVGIVTASDLVAMLAETDERPPVSEVMSAPVRTTDPTATLSDAAATMRSAGVRQLPVVDEDGYRGLLTVRALAPYLSRHNLDIEWDGEPKRVRSRGDAGLRAFD